MKLRQNVGKLREIAGKIGVDAVQIFTKLPRSFVKSTIEAPTGPAPDAPVVFVHGQYIISLAKSRLIRPAKISIIEDLLLCEIHGFAGVSFHIGSSHPRRNREETLEIVTDNLAKIADYMKIAGIKNARFLIENQPAQGRKIAATPEDLAEIRRRVIARIGRKKWKKYFGFTLDTCHFFISGIPIGKSLIKRLKNAGIVDDDVYLIHANDAGSRTRDIHAPPFTGKIPEKGLLAFFRHYHKKRIPLIVEVMEPTAANSLKKRLIRR